VPLAGQASLHASASSRQHPFLHVAGTSIFSPLAQLHVSCQHSLSLEHTSDVPQALPPALPP